MENTDIIVLSSVISILFLVFIVSIARELINSKESVGEETGPRANMIRKVGKLFDTQKKIKK